MEQGYWTVYSGDEMIWTGPQKDVAWECFHELDAQGLNARMEAGDRWFAENEFATPKEAVR